MQKRKHKIDKTKIYESTQNNQHRIKLGDQYRRGVEMGNKKMGEIKMQK